MLDLTDVFRSWKENLLRSIKISLPGYITEYDTETRRATIQLTIKFEKDGETIDPPLLREVSIRQNNAPAVCFYVPPAVGALVDVIFSDFSLAEYQESDGLTLVEPQDTQKHGLNNPYAVLQVETLQNRHRIDDPTLPGIYLREDTKLFLGRLGGGQEEVLNLLHQTVEALTNLTNYIQTQITFSHSPGNPSGPPTNAALLQPILTELTAVATGLQSLGKIEPV